jgi:hypothetical protein
LQISLSPKVAVYLMHVLLPIAMIRSKITGVLRQVFCNGGDPYLPAEIKISLVYANAVSSSYSSKTHVLDVIEIHDDALPRSTTIHAQRRIAGR